MDSERQTQLEADLRAVLDRTSTAYFCVLEVYRAYGLGEPDEPQADIKAFVAECVDRGRRRRVTTPTLWRAYNRWCATTGRDPCPRRGFLRGLERHLPFDNIIVQRGGRNPRIWLGVGVTSPPTPKTPPRGRNRRGPDTEE